MKSPYAAHQEIQRAVILANGGGHERPKSDGRLSSTHEIRECHDAWTLRLKFRCELIALIAIVLHSDRLTGITALEL